MRLGAFIGNLRFTAPRLLVLIAALRLGACGGDDTPGGDAADASGDAAPDASDDGSSAQVCTPGVTRTCVGPDACDGEQECAATSFWGPCDCGSPADAGGDVNHDGSAGTAGNGGSAGTAGSGGSAGTAGSGGSAGTAGGGGVADSGSDGSSGSAGSGGSSGSTATDAGADVSVGGAAGGPSTDSGADAADAQPADTTPPTLLTILPANNSTSVPFGTSIQVIFSEAISPASVGAGEISLREAGNVVPTTMSIDGDTVTLTPSYPLGPSTQYTAQVTGAIGDLAGNVVFFNKNSVFWTAGLTTFIDLTGPITRVVYDEVDNVAYGLDTAGNRVIVIDLTSKTITNEVSLSQNPFDLCVHPKHSTYYVAHPYVAPTGAIVSEYDLGTHQKIREMVWPGPSYSASNIHFHLECLTDYLLLVDASWAPSLWTMTYDSPPVATDHSTVVAGIGELVASSDEKSIFLWYQYGWSAGYAGSNVYRFDVAGSTFAQGDDALLGYPFLQRDPLDTPIFLDEARNNVVTKQLVLDAANLTQIKHTFSSTEKIYAYAKSHGWAASRARIFELDTYQSIRTTGHSGSGAMFFDKTGTLFMVRAPPTRLYYLAP